MSRNGIELLYDSYVIQGAGMAISVRLSDESETELRGRARRRGQPISEFVREAIEEKLQREEQAGGAYALGVDLFGRYASGDDNRSSDRKKLIGERARKKISEKYHR